MDTVLVKCLYIITLILMIIALFDDYSSFANTCSDEECESTYYNGYCDWCDLIGAL